MDDRQLDELMSLLTRIAVSQETIAKTQQEFLVYISKMTYEIYPDHDFENMDALGLRIKQQS